MTNNLPIYVINLAGSQDRRQFMQQQFDRLFSAEAQQQVHFFEAVNGKENPDHPLFKRHYNEKKRLATKGQPLTLSQLGCYASHYLLWEKCVALNTPILVLEDDAKFNDHFLTVLNFMQSAQNRFEFLWLQPDRLKNKKTVVEQFDGFSVQRFSKGFTGTTGYYLTPIAAQKFLQQAQEWYLTVDVTMDRFFENNVPPYAIVPPCLEADEAIESTIYQKQKKDRSLKTKLNREYFALTSAIKRTWYNLTHK